MDRNFGIPLGKYYSKMDVKIGDSIKIEFRKKIINAKVHKIGYETIDAVASDKYYFCPTFDQIRNIYTNVKITKSYNTK